MAKTIKKSKKSERVLRSSKEDRLFQNLLKITEQFMGGKSFSGLTEKELRERLSLPDVHQAVFKEVLDELLSQGSIELKDEVYSFKKPEKKTVKGILRMHPRGFGFVQLDNADLYGQDIFIPKQLTKNGVDGDVVEVIVEEIVTEKGPEGRVVAILSRARTHMAGIIRDLDKEGQFIIHAPLLGAQQKVILKSTDEIALKVGDRIVMEVIDWGSKESTTYAKFSHYLGHISDPSCDITAAIEEFELRADFPTQAVEEAESYGKQVSVKDIKMREDLRDLVTLTIDPDTAKDFDDAISLTKDLDGTYNLGVHIADVSHYVKPGTALDEEAQVRCNSTYFPSLCIPMLPGALSENLCSLKPNVNRLTVSVLMRFSPGGDLLDYRMARTVIKSAKRFTYKEAKKVIDGQMESPHKDSIGLMVELCRLLKQKRYERGSIEFSLPELVILVDDKGKPTGTDYITYDITHQMVEEFMLKANELVATELNNRGKNLTYRVHDVPAEENLKDFSLLATAFGFKISDIPTPQDLQKLFEEAAETPYSNYLASNYIRRMRLAAYSAENIGHYGLSLSHYCHFTSPIRRYVDLVVHRILFDESDDLTYLQEVAARCSNQERISAKAEGSVVLLKKLRLLHEMHTGEPFREYEAIITKVKNFGVYFEIVELLLEGFIHISELGDDYFIYEEEQMRLRGSRKGDIYSPGNGLTVMLKDVNFIILETKWYIVATEKKVDVQSERKGRYQKKNRSQKDKFREVPENQEHLQDKSKEVQPKAKASSRSLKKTDKVKEPQKAKNKKVATKTQPKPKNKAKSAVKEASPTKVVKKKTASPQAGNKAHVVEKPKAIKTKIKSNLPEIPVKPKTKSVSVTKATESLKQNAEPIEKPFKASRPKLAKEPLRAKDIIFGKQTTKKKS